jgi:GNAT superfamily N-acetyltransferase
MEKANLDDREELIGLWKNVFGDTDEFLSDFFDSVFDADNTFLIKENGIIASVFYMINSDVVLGNKKYSAKYLYAAQTHPGFRKRGFMSKLIKSSADYYKANGTDFIFLCPASEHLYDYYGKLGFFTAFYDKFLILTKIEIDKNRNVTGEGYFCSDFSYTEMRKNIMSKNYADFDDNFLEFAERSEKSDGGKSISALFEDGDRVYILCHSDDETLCVTECFSEYGNFNHILDILKNENSEKFKIKLPADFPAGVFNFDVKKQGMILYLNGILNKSNFIDGNEKIYLGQPCE